jgi:hypothetical protein
MNDLCTRLEPSNSVPGESLSERLQPVAPDGDARDPPDDGDGEASRVGTGRDPAVQQPR